MSTHMPGFQSFFSFFASLCNVKISNQQRKGSQVTAPACNLHEPCEKVGVLNVPFRTNSTNPNQMVY